MFKFDKKYSTGCDVCRSVNLPSLHTTAQVDLAPPKLPLSLFLSWHLEVSRRPSKISTK